MTAFKKTVLGTLAAVVAMANPVAALAESLTADVWVDNWFAFYLNDEKVAEDSVPITTERSFNKESFSFEAERPFALNFIVKDFKENDTGLEYIGSQRQQMGDGGFIAQILDSSGNPVAVTNADWRCLVTHEAPLDKRCEKSRNPDADCGFTETAEPDGWTSVSFDDSDWPHATEHSAQEVGPKDGYDEVRWHSSAKIIWGPDLETNNTLLCRIVIE